MKHDYTPKEILHAWNHRKYLSGQTQTEANLIAFLDALPMKSAEPALRQPILADDGRSLGRVAFDAGNAIQKIKFPKQEIETWEESAEVRDMLEAAAQAVAAEVEARMIKRMEAVPAEELEKAYWDGNEAVACHTALKRVRARLIAAVKGEGQPVVVNEPPQNERQPDLSGESEKQAEPATFEAHGYTWTRHTPGDPMPCDGEAQIYILCHDNIERSCCVTASNARWDKINSADIIGWRYADEPAQPTTSPGWTPTVGQTVRLKSGGPVMVVHHIAKDGSIACTHNINGAFEFATLPASCLTPVPNP